jgi:hypothetical protein
MGSQNVEPETAESIIARHKQVQASRNKFVYQARDGKRKLAATQGIAIPKWEMYWKELDEWKDLMVEEEIDLAPTPPTTPIPRPRKPKDLENVGANAKE